MKSERKQMLDKLIDEIVEEMYQYDKLMVEKLRTEELRLMHVLYENEKKNPCGLFHCRSVLKTYKTLLSKYGLECK